MKHLDHQPPGPTAPAAVGSVLPAARSTGPSAGARTCARLARLLSTVTKIDELQAEAVSLAAGLQCSGEDVEQTGIPAEQWLAIEGRMTRSDRRMLAAVAEHLQHLPLTGREFARGGLSWSQVRILVTILLREKPRTGEWETFDEAIVCAIGQAGDEPDEVIRLFEDWLYRRRPESIEEAEADAADRRYLAIQPRLDGTGGRFWGDTDAAGLAVLDSSTAPTPDQLGDGDGLTPVGKVGRARHDNLLARLATSGDTGLPDLTNLLTMDVDTLLGLSRTHAELLSTLAGGRLRVSAPTARRLLAGGFDTRLIVLDETGQILGVGRKARIAPDWLRDALLVRDATCTHPSCQRAGRTCQADHAVPWWPTGDDRPGPTDVENLALVCGSHNRAKERDGWKVRGHDDGSRTWHHPRSGLSIRTTPTTRRLQPPEPPPRPPSDDGPTSETFATPPSGSDPPAPF